MGIWRGCEGRLRRRWVVECLFASHASHWCYAIREHQRQSDVAAQQGGGCNRGRLTTFVHKLRSHHNFIELHQATASVAHDPPCLPPLRSLGWRLDFPTDPRRRTSSRNSAGALCRVNRLGLGVMAIPGLVLVRQQQDESRNKKLQYTPAVCDGFSHIGPAFTALLRVMRLS